MLIGNQMVNGEGDEELVINPATGETIKAIAGASEAQVVAAIDAAERAFPSWALLTPGERAGFLLKLADAIEANAEEFAKLESLNCGKPLARALEDEIPAIVDCFRFFAGAARTMHASAAGEYMAGHTSMIRRDPLGVVGSIAPWNYP
ncbi:MAG: aldehyde dehydrogenase family protein, partial [Deinococcales bacterium]